MSSSAVSVLTLAKGRSAHLERLIEGLRRSDMAPAELIVVDLDGGYQPPVSDRFPIQVINLPSAVLPLAQARNTAAAAATAEVLLFLDVDCIPRRSLVGAMTKHGAGTPGLICAEVRYLGPGEMTDDWREDVLLERALPHPARPFPNWGLRREMNYGLFWSLAFGISRARYARLGGFDESFVGYGAEDTDLGFRAEAAAIGLYFLGGTGALHQHHDVFDPPLQHFDDIVRNALHFHRKWKAWPMEGWLDDFDARGFIRWRNDGIEIVREPTAQEIAEAKTAHRY